MRSKALLRFLPVRVLEVAWLGGRVTRKIAIAVPSARLHFAIASISALIGYLVRGPSKHALRNIEESCGNQTCAATQVIARDFTLFSKSSYVWSVLLGRRGFDELRYFDVRGLNNLRAALEHGRGVMLLTAHFGYAKWIPRILQAHGFRVRRVVVNDPRGEKKQRIDQWLASRGRLTRYLYERTQVYSEPRSGDDIIASLDVRPIIKALSANQIVLIAGDGVRATSFVQLPLLGQLYPFATGFAKIAAIQGSAVLPIFAFPVNRNRIIRAEIGRPVAISPETSIEDNVQRYAETLNDQLTLTPHLWQLWSRPDWFKNARRWASEQHEDPFTSSPPWSGQSARHGDPG